MNQQTHYILLALGSNVGAELHIEQAKARLSVVFPQLRFSRSLITPAIGIVSPPFINCLAEGYCCVPLEEVIAALKDIEAQMGSVSEERKKGIVKIDIDLLQFDDMKRKADDWSRDYIQLLLNELSSK
jgi:7,8-dihydro-6-hydroxymethylpterin-pyrophosphokinase (HPPK)